MGAVAPCCCKDEGAKTEVVIANETAVAVVATEVKEDLIIDETELDKGLASKVPMGSRTAADDTQVVFSIGAVRDGHTLEEASPKKIDGLTREHDGQVVVAESSGGPKMDIEELGHSDQASSKMMPSANDEEYFERQWIDGVKLYCGVEPRKQLEALDQFLQAIRADASIPPVSHKLVALRFLRARKFDIQKSLDMYKAAMQWRKEYAEPAMSEVISAQKASQLEKAYPSRLIGRDVQGRPCKVFDIGAIELRNSPVSADDLVRHHIRQMEIFSQALAWRDMRLPPPDAVTAAASPLEGGLVIIDICNCSVGRFWNSQEFYKRMAAIDQNYYPEIMWKTLIVTRGHWAFDMAWGVAVKFLDAHTISKVEAIAAKDPSKRLAELVPQDVLPPEYRSKKST